MAFPENYLEGEKAKIFKKSKFFLSGTMNYHKKKRFQFVPIRTLCLYNIQHVYSKRAMVSIQVPYSVI